MPYGTRGAEIEFDFHRHVVECRVTDGREKQVRLEPRSVADFYAELLGRLAELDVTVKIMPRPVEVPEAIPFPEDDVHASYDAEYAYRFWLALVHTKLDVAEDWRRA